MHSNSMSNVIHSRIDNPLRAETGRIHIKYVSCTMNQTQETGLAARLTF